MSATELILEIHHNLDKVEPQRLPDVNSFLGRWREVQSLLQDKALDPTLTRVFHQLQHDIEQIEAVLRTASSHAKLEEQLLASVDVACQRSTDSVSWIHRYPHAHAFFLANIHYPFPSKRTLAALAKQSHCSTSDLKQWFSRMIGKLGYGVIRDTFCHGDKRLLRNYLRQTLSPDGDAENVPRPAREAILCLKRRAESLLNPLPKKSPVVEAVLDTMRSRTPSPSTRPRHSASQLQWQPVTQSTVSRKRKTGPSEDEDQREDLKAERKTKRPRSSKTPDLVPCTSERSASSTPPATPASVQQDPLDLIDLLEGECGQIPPIPPVTLFDAATEAAETSFLPGTQTSLGNPASDLFDPRTYQTGDVLVKGLDQMGHFYFDAPGVYDFNTQQPDLPPYSQVSLDIHDLVTQCSKDPYLLFPDLFSGEERFDLPSYEQASQIPPTIFTPDMIYTL